jgi:hypothetical protein
MRQPGVLEGWHPCRTNWSASRKDYVRTGTATGFSFFVRGFWRAGPFGTAEDRRIPQGTARAPQINANALRCVNDASARVKVPEFLGYTNAELVTCGCVLECTAHVVAATNGNGKFYRRGRRGRGGTAAANIHRGGVWTRLGQVPFSAHSASSAVKCRCCCRCSCRWVSMPVSPSTIRVIRVERRRRAC